MNLTKFGRVLAIVEDVQWIDPTMENLLIDVLGGIEDLQAMILATNRDRSRRAGMSPVTRPIFVSSV